MKRSILNTFIFKVNSHVALISIFLVPSFFNGASAQNDSINQVKYWKLRNNFLEKFIKIGPESGESLPAGALVPSACIDNVASDGTDPAKWESTDYGEMHWGDGMIRHGHYLALLATEYALKKRNDQDVTGTLNELYYAIYAIDRLDIIAESSLNSVYGTEFEENLNGFYLRDDVPEDFCQYWKNEDMNFSCTNSSFYENNNVAKLLEPESHYVVKPITTYQNVPSMDQMSSLMVGLALVHKLVDDVYIQPKRTDHGFNIVSEAQAIVQRMVMYASNRNWEIIDVNGWPVANGGGDLSVAAYPYVQAASRITGNPVSSYSDHFYRKRLKFHPKYFELQHCITGYGTSGGPDRRDESCKHLNIGFMNSGLKSMYKELTPGAIPGPLNNQYGSVYLDWNYSGYHHSIEISKSFWDSGVLNFASKTFLSMKAEAENPGLRSMEGISSFNQAIIFNIGISGGTWNSSMSHFYGNKTENRQLELTNAVLYDLEPHASKEFYQKYLNSMSILGPFNIIGKNWTPNPEGPWFSEFLCSPNGWGADFRWTEPDQAYGDIVKEGVYSGLDYMVLHNLYCLAFAGDVPAYEQDYSCFNEDDLKITIEEGLAPENVEAFNYLNKKLKYVPTQNDNAFKSVYNRVNGMFTVEPLFKDYVELGINITKYQTENVQIKAGGQLTIKSPLVIFKDKILSIETDGKLYTVSGNVMLSENSTIDVSGELRIGNGTTLKLDSKCKMILREGSILIVEEGASFIVEDPAMLEIYPSAEIVTEGENVDLILTGSIRMMSGGTFKVNSRLR